MLSPFLRYLFNLCTIEQQFLPRSFFFVIDFVVLYIENELRHIRFEADNSPLKSYNLFGCFYSGAGSLFYLALSLNFCSYTKMFLLNHSQHLHFSKSSE